MSVEFCEVVNTYKDAKLYSYKWWLYRTACSLNTSDEVIETVARMCYEAGLNEDGESNTCIWHEHAKFLQVLCKCSLCNKEL